MFRLGEKMTAAWTMGVDVGSVSAKGVIFNGEEWLSCLLPTGWAPREAGQEVYQRLLTKAGVSSKDVAMIIGTGYGRVKLDFVQRTMSEIACHAKGAHFLNPKTRGVIDIGGQDSKAILISPDGTVKDFILNDKCAAGTGRFLQVIAQTLGYELTELGEVCRDALPVEIGSMCAVFAESEVISLIAQGVPKERIIAGTLLSIAKRVAAMAGRLPLGPQVTFCGGVAQNQVLAKYLQEQAQWEIKAAPEPQLVGALGAAVLAYEMVRKGDTKNES